MFKSLTGYKLMGRDWLKTTVCVGAMMTCGVLLVKTAGPASVSDGRFAAIRGENPECLRFCAASSRRSE